MVAALDFSVGHPYHKSFFSLAQAAQIQTSNGIWGTHHILAAIVGCPYALLEASTWNLLSRKSDWFLMHPLRFLIFPNPDKKFPNKEEKLEKKK